MLKVAYNLEARFLGLSGQMPTPAAQLLYKQDHFVKIRAADPLPKLGVTQTQEGALKGTFGSNGTCTVQGSIARDLVFQNQDFAARVTINNATSKKEVAGVKMRLLREVRARARDFQGVEKSFEVDSVVMKTFWKLKVGAQCPDLVPFDTMIRMSTNVKDVTCEEGRFLMLYDIETGQDLPM